jgi:hypothetical protein
MDAATWIAVVHDVDAIIGGIVFGTISERVRRRPVQEHSEPGLPEG